jgi:signal transduction histidine kinase
MNPPTISELSERYLTALRTHLEKGAEASLHEAHEIGCQAVFLNLETLDVATIHEEALASLLSSDLSMNARKDLTNCASVFFIEALTEIEGTHQAAVRINADLKQMHTTLGRLTLDLADSNRHLEKGIHDRKQAEAALEAGAENFRRMLKESRILERHLQNVVRKILSVNEVERWHMSLQLNDEIAQTMLGIHVRLLALKKAHTSSQASLSKEISTIQRLVQKSAKTINSFTREFDTAKQR